MTRRASIGLIVAGWSSGILAMLPFAWLICASLKTGSDLLDWTFLPWSDLKRISLTNYAELFATADFPRLVVNSLFLASVQSILLVIISGMAGFALAWHPFPGRTYVFAALIAMMLLPAPLLLPASYAWVSRLGMLDSYLAVLLPGSASAFGVLLYHAAMLRVPKALLDAARMDGASVLRIWWDVAMPMCRPTTGAFVLLSFLATWNSYLWPQVVLLSRDRHTLAIGLSNMMSLPQYRTEYGVLMAGTVVAILPVILLFLMVQRDFVSGLYSGGVRES
jgi:ABC-type glycerol-3-phosphate transport system permease component